MNTRKSMHFSATNPTRRQVIVDAALVLGGLGLASVEASGGTTEEISHAAESIHDETVLKATRKRVYEALTDAKQFHQVTQLSAAVKSGMAPGNVPAEIRNEAGGAFSLFGGSVTASSASSTPFDLNLAFKGLEILDLRLTGLSLPELEVKL